MTFVKLSIFTILLSVIVFQSDSAGHPIHRRAVLKTYNDNKFVGKWYVIGVLYMNHSPITKLECPQLHVERFESHSFQMEFTGVLSQQKSDSMFIVDISNDKIYTVPNNNSDDSIKYTIMDYENSDEIVLQNHRVPSFIILSRTPNISDDLWKNYSEFATGANKELVRASHEGCT